MTSPSEAHLILKSTTNVSLQTEVPLNPRGTSFGRAADLVDVVLGSARFPSVLSRNHARIYYEGNTWRISDSGSVNGVMVNGIKRAQTALQDGDEIEFGGGGNLTEGARKPQTSIDIVYVFKVGPAPNKKRKRTDEDDAEEREHIAKQARLEGEAAAKAVAEEQMKRELEEIRARMKTEQEAERARFEEEKKVQQEQDRARYEEERRLEAERVDKERKELEAKLEAEAAAHAEKAAKVVEAKAEAEEAKKIGQATMQEIEKLQAELADKAARDQKEKEELRKQLDDQQKKHDQEKLNIVKVDDLEEEIMCAVCQEVMVKVTQLECSHQFCSKCILAWFTGKPAKDKICPVCRKVSKGGTHNLVMDNLIEKIMNGRPQAEMEAFTLRKNPNAVLKKALVPAPVAAPRPAQPVAAPAPQPAAAQAQVPAPAPVPGVPPTPLQRLQQLLAVARERNFVFLRITDIWDLANRQSFARGIAPYVNDGQAKQLYCQAIGLTEGFITSASPTLVQRACANLGETQGNVEQQRTWLRTFMTSPAMPPSAAANTGGRPIVRIDL